MKRALLISCLALLGLAAGGCAGRVAYARMPPPPPRVESYGYAPGPGYVRVDGYWRWSGNRYAWVPGQWSRAPRNHRAWVPGRWESGRHGYVWRPGYWR